MIARRYWVCLLECVDGMVYAGWTTDVERLLRADSTGRGSRHTRRRCPVRIVYREECLSENIARNRESALRRLRHAQKLQLIERGGEID
ncbi:MAG: GIY-YIG nuclease family protein [Anaerolineae bacterium]|nr:GIY-YIG nuclease family protein [Anaerolineae bacterium]